MATRKKRVTKPKPTPEQKLATIMATVVSMGAARVAFASPAQVNDCAYTPDTLNSTDIVQDIQYKEFRGDLPDALCDADGVIIFIPVGWLTGKDLETLFRHNEENKDLKQWLASDLKF